MSPSQSTTYSKFGVELADALEQVAGDPELVGNPSAALEVLGIALPPEVDAAALDFDPEGLLRAADAIRSKAAPVFWPWVWWIPWVGFAPPEGENES